jgi:translocator protein
VLIEWVATGFAQRHVRSVAHLEQNGGADPRSNRTPLGAAPGRRPRKRDIGGLLGFLAASGTVAGIGGRATVDAVRNCYPTLDKPPWTRPNAVFGPVWTVLYAVMAVAAWRIWRQEGFHEARFPLLLYGAQLVANLAWMPIFFGAGQIGTGLAIIVVLDVLVAATLAAFLRRDRIAGLLLVPYLAWCLYATSLNAGDPRPELTRDTRADSARLMI